MLSEKAKQQLRDDLDRLHRYEQAHPPPRPPLRSFVLPSVSDDSPAKPTTKRRAPRST